MAQTTAPQDGTGNTGHQPWSGAFWQGRRVLVTGHTGFKGAWLSAWLQRAGAIVTGYSLPLPARESGIWQSIGTQLIARGMTDARGDIRDASALQSAVAGCRPEIVFHLAAQAIVIDSYDDPVFTWDVNVMGTLGLLQALAQGGHKATFIGVTSDKCYDNREWTWGYRESDPLGGKDPYSASKAACELLLASWRHSFGTKSGIRVASARAGNVIGGGDTSPHRIVPDLLRAFTAGEAAQIRNPHSTRPYQHVLEPLSGYLALARKVHEDGGAYEQAFNFGPAPDGERRTQWIAETAASLWGKDARIRLASLAGQPHEAGSLMLDSSKARHMLAWTPTWQIRDALAATIEWHRSAQKSAEQAMIETEHQLARFEQAKT